MDLKSGELLWPKLSLPQRYPQLTRDERCDALVVGAGVSGAFVAYHLARAGVDTVVIDAREVASGSTPASTALVQYEIDTPLLRLSRRLGWDHAAGAYRVCRGALDEFREVVSELDDDCDLTLRPSVFLGRRTREVRTLRREVKARQSLGIDVEFLTRRALQRQFGIDRPAAMLSACAYEIDPLRLTTSLLRGAVRAGARVYAKTEAHITSARMHDVRLRVGRRLKVRARSAILATGYETPEFFRGLRRFCKLRSTYALASTPLAASDLWPRRALIWESGDPYFYARTTADGRVLVGGEDEDIVDPRRRDRLIGSKARMLARKLARLIPHAQIEPELAWAGTFAQSYDGLPFIGATRDFPGWYFALGYGGNGLTFSLIAAKILCDSVRDRTNGDGQLFTFDRPRVHRG